MSDDGRARVGGLHMARDRSKQIRIPCRYCKDLTDFSEDLILGLAKWSRETIERRGEHPIRNDEVAVCPACRSRYLEEFFPQTHYVEQTIAEEDWGEPDSEPDPWSQREADF